MTKRRDCDSGRKLGRMLAEMRTRSKAMSPPPTPPPRAPVEGPSSAAPAAQSQVGHAPAAQSQVGHIQCYCTVLQLPRIAIHHGIWRELMFSIRKSSTELKYASEPQWHFPSARSPEVHAEWGLYKILEYMGLHEILPPGAGQNRVKLRKDFEEYHIACAIDFDDTDMDTFIARRPDGLALDKEKNYVYCWNTPEPWIRMKTGQRRRSRRKMKDIAPI